ncbi:MAG: hypothetical protein ACKVRN_03245 [Pyrinomonadaceae bacterium]
MDATASRQTLIPLKLKIPMRTHAGGTGVEDKSILAPSLNLTDLIGQVDRI